MRRPINANVTAQAGRHTPASLRLLGLALLATALLLAASSAARAARPYVSQLTQANGTSFSSPFGLAVDGSDNLWVSDTGTSLVSKFDSSGGFLAQNTGTGSWNGSAYNQDLAFGSAASLVYAVDSNFGDLWRLNVSDATYAGVDLRNGLGGGCCYIRAAVDNSGGANDGDVYVGGPSGTVVRIDGSDAASSFSASAAYITGNQLTGTPAHGLGGVGDVAVDASGDVYVVDTGNLEVDQFDSTGTFVKAFTGSFSVLSAVAVDPTTGNVLVGDSGLGVVHEFDSSGGFLGDTDGSGTPGGSFSPQGLAVDSTGTLYVADASHPVVDSFGPPAVTHVLSVSATGSGVGVVTSSPSGINCGAGCTASFNEGSTVTLTATPDAHSTFTGWTVDGDDTICPGTDPCGVSIGTTDHAVVATFEAIPQHDVTVALAGNGTGSVTSSPAAIDCGQACTSPFDVGTSVTLTATTAFGSTFTGWTVDGDDTICPGTDPCTVSVGSTDRAVVATFEAIPSFGLTVAASGSGSLHAPGIACPTDCSQSYFVGSPVTISAKSVANHHFVGWSGDCSGNGSCQVTMDAAHSVTATFAINTHAVNVTKGGTGSGTVTSSSAGIDCGPTCSADYDHGTAVTLTAAAAAGSTFTGWSGSCTGTATCQVTVNKAEDVTATFTLKPPTGTAPPADTDGDGVPDAIDQCDNQAGPASNHGCPVVAPAAGKLTVVGMAKIKDGKALVKVSCAGAAGAAACKGAFKLVAKIKVGHKKRTKVIGTVSFGPVAAGESARIEVTLSRLAKRILAKTGKLKVSVDGLRGSEIANDGQTVVLKDGKKQ